MSKEAMKLALEALEAIAIHGDLACVVTPDGVFYLQPAITALREALAEQPAQKCSYPYCGCNSKAWCKVERNEALDKKAENARELGLDYEPARDSGIVTAGGADPRTQRTWVGLTPDELNAIFDSMKTWNSFQITDVYFAIEAKLKEKNNG